MLVAPESELLGKGLESRYRARFYFDPNGIVMNDGATPDKHSLLAGRNGSGYVFEVQFRKSAGNYQVNISIYNDAGGTSNSAWYTISDAAHYIEIDWQAATGDGANNGSLALWIDGVLKTTLSGKDNDTLRVEEVHFGPLTGIDSAPPALNTSTPSSRGGVHTLVRRAAAVRCSR